MNRKIWANLSYLEGNFYFSLNEEIEEETTLLFLETKTITQSLEEFLLSSRLKSQNRLKVCIRKIFVSLDLDKEEKLILSESKFLSNYKLIDSLKKSHSALPNLWISKKFLTKITKAAQTAGLEIAALNFANQVLANYLNSKFEHKNFLILQTTQKSINLLSFRDSRLTKFGSVEFHWDSILSRLQKSFLLSKSQIEFFLLSVFDFSGRDYQSLHPQIKNSTCIWHLRREIKNSLAKLSFPKTQSSTMFVVGFLAKIQGFGKHLQKNLPKLEIHNLEKELKFSSFVELNNQAYNFLISKRKEKNDFAYNTGDFELKLYKSSKMFKKLERFIKFFSKFPQKTNKLVCTT